MLLILFIFSFGVFSQFYFVGCVYFVEDCFFGKFGFKFGKYESGCIDILFNYYVWREGRLEIRGFERE